MHGLIAWLGKKSPEEIAGGRGWDASVFRAARKHGEGLGYNVEYFWLNDPKVSLRRLEQILLSRGVQGVVVATQTYSRGRVKLNLDRYSAVAIGRTLHSPKIDQVSPDHFYAVVSCYRHLYGQGYRRIGLAISKRFDERSLGLWYAGFLLEQVRKKASPAIPILDCPQDDAKTTQQWINRWKPDCIITAIEETPPVTLPLADMIRSFGIDIPGSMAVTLVNLTESATLSEFSGIKEPVEELGTDAIDILARRINYNTRGVPEHRVVSCVEGSWREGLTSPPKK